MALGPGTRLGQYEVVAKLGEGGMGEVYRARDTKLNRIVAIKALHASVAADPERVARFDREAQLLASLNHPNIAAIHGLQDAEGATYLVLEHVDGRPLSDVIRETGPMALGEALAIARQVADAIAAAHEKGIIHRDLKPGNVMVTGDGLVKVLDFGLGKALDEGRSRASGAGQANSPTMTLAATQQGIILGTAGYMSPEQAKGRDADKRADVWAFGCVLFELLTGKRAFEGEDITETLAAIVRGEPNWPALPAGLPPALRTLIERCLVKDRGQRLSDMSVVRYILSEPASGAAAPVPSALVATPAPNPRARGLSWPLVAGLLLVTAVATWGATRLSTPASSTAPTRLERFSIVLPEGDSMVNVNMLPMAFAPDRSSIVFSGARGGKNQLFLRELSGNEWKPLPGTDGGVMPFFSPDSRWIGFFALGKLKKITVGGTGLQELADAGDPRGGAWAQNDVIYAPSNISSLMKVSASGGPAVALTQVDRGAGEVSHRWPVSIENGGAVVFAVWTGPGLDEHRLERLSLADGRRDVLVRGVDSPGLVAGGFLIHSGRQDAVLALPWQAGRASLEGIEPQRVPLEARNDNEGLAAMTMSDDGSVAFLQGGAGRKQARVLWIDRAGSPTPLPMPEREYFAAVVSPDGKRAVLQIEGGIQELWLYEFASQTMTPFVNSGGSSQAPVWTADGKAVIYRGTRAGYRNLFRKALAGGDEERLTTKADVVHTPTSVSKDGKWLAFNEAGTGTRGGSDVLVMPLDGSPDAKPLVATTASEINGQISPDGRWLAYESTVSGRVEVWVRPFMADGSPSQVSREGGEGSRWSPDSRELYFLSTTGLMSASMSGENAGTPRQFIAGRFVRPTNANSNYSVAADGRGLLMVQPVRPDRPVTQIEVVLNVLHGLVGIRK